MFKISALAKIIHQEEGISLISMALIMMVVGFFLTVGGKMYETYGRYEASVVTDEHMDYVDKAMTRFLSENGRYPCPAPLTAGIDTATFGLEVATDCTAGPVAAGTFRQMSGGASPQGVRTGAIPTRTLGIDDKYMFDGYKNRLMYTVTEQYAVAGTVVTGDNGGIDIIDAAGNTSTNNNIVKVVYSMGLDQSAFTYNGIQTAACAVDGAGQATTFAAENCDADTVYVNTVNKSNNPNPANFFVHKIRYTPSRTAEPCIDGAGGDQINDIAFVIDSSGSMFWADDGSVHPDGFNVQCPASMPGCSRMDVARWAMRRAVPTQVYTNSLQSAPGTTSMTDFVGYNTIANVNGNMGNIEFFDPAVLTQDSNGDGIIDIANVDTDGDTIFDAFDIQQYINNTVLATLETELQSMCPGGSTPLGLHIQAVADRMGDGTPTRPNKIIVLSDGVSNNGPNPVTIATNIAATYPNIQIDIIDVVGNPGMMQISQLTNGSYYRTDNPDALLDALADSTGACAPYNANPTDQQGCGSAGGWWLAP